jgi:hypothetical protein
MRGFQSIALFTVLWGCAESATPQVPTLEITSPQRGTFTDQDTVEVTGRVSDDGPVLVTVNGTSVTPEADGTFRTTLLVGSGLAFVETHAIDQDGNDVRDVRAVMAGPAELTDGRIAAPIAARADAPALAKIGDAIADTAEQIDFNAAVQAMNPVFQDDGCLGAVVNVTSVSLSNIGAQLTPIDGAIDTRVAIDNVVVRANVRYRVSCITGNTTVTIRATRARIAGALGVRVSGGKLVTSLPSPTVALDGFSFDVSGVPGVIEDLLRTRVRDAVANALRNVIRDRVPGIAEDALAGLIARPGSFSLLGHTTNIGVVPSTLELTPAGLYVAVDSTVVVSGGEGGLFVVTPAEASSALMAGGEGLGVALADDLPNQLFAGLWAAGAFDMSLTIDQIGPAATLFDDDVVALDVRMMLPPAISATGDLTLGIGDLVLTGRDSAGAEVQSLALSARTTLVAEPTSSGTISLALGTPDLRAQVLAESEAVQQPLQADRVEGIVGGAWGLIGQLANDALGNLPMPQVGGVQLGTPAVTGRDGFVLTAIPLR